MMEKVLLLGAGLALGAVGALFVVWVWVAKTWPRG